MTGGVRLGLLAPAERFVINSYSCPNAATQHAAANLLGAAAQIIVGERTERNE